MTDALLPAPGEFLVYASDNGKPRVQVRISDGTVWLTQRQMADLYQVTVSAVNQHLANIYGERELEPEATIKKFLTVRTEGNRSVSRLVDHYSLPAILAIGYRVRSAQGTRFRQWATTRLDEYLIKGFVMDDERLKSAGNLGEDYFEELLRGSAGFAPPSGASTRRSPTSMLSAASTTTRRRRSRRPSTPPCRTRCTGPFTVTRLRRSSTSAPTRRNATWD